MKIRYFNALVAACVLLMGALARAADTYLGGSITNMTSLPTRILIMLDNGVHKLNPTRRILRDYSVRPG